MDDVRDAIFSMGENKLHGPDGFHVLFFQKNWDIVGTNVVKVCLEILNGGQSIEALNDTNAVLFQRRKEHAKCQIITRSVTVISHIGL